ncbi:hypothetical protein AAZX31_04G202400 [Glycine max]|nr:hypothetical protein GLYMA_04G221450v4 [Glycine max]KAH1112618.1 hypothetical protein GYH30_010738 [Glycine max]
MAKHLAAMLLLVFLLLTSSTSTSADNNFAATEPSLNLALPSDRRVAGGKYGPMILNMLPKGPVPPSGPSKGTNNLNN